MLKRILFTGLVLLVFYSAALVGYRLNEPEKITAESTPWTEQAITYDSLKDYTLNSGSAAIHYYFFCTAGSDDCMYMVNTVLPTVARDTNLDLSSLIEFVDVSSLENNMETNRLKEEWNISSYPAFVTCHVDQGKIVVDNAIESSVSAPLSAENVEDWLAKNNLYTAGGEGLIETPKP